MSSLDAFKEAMERGILGFEDNQVFKAISSGLFDLANYKSLLFTLFHQTLHASPTFALAGVNTPLRLMAIREYLLEHAGEETRHWDWLKSDIKNLGCEVDGLLESNPAPSTLEYVGMNYFFANVKPLARLGSAAVLEGIGARYGGKYGARLIEMLRLKKDCVTFFTSHGSTDVKHIQEIVELIEGEKLLKQDYDDLIFGAAAASRVYAKMYDESLLKKEMRWLVCA